MNLVKTKYLRWVFFALIVCGLGSVNTLTVTAQEIQQSKTIAAAKNARVTSAKDVQWLISKVKSSKKHEGLNSVDATNVKRFEALLIETLQIKNNTEFLVADFVGQWAELHWQIELSPSKSIFTIREAVNHRHGRGVYAFRIDAKEAIALQAPHRFYDLMTGTISTKLFCENSISAIALNTVHRKEIDLSHTKLHYINAFTSAIIKAQLDVAIVQLHGFTNRGKSGPAKFAQAIVSDTTKFPGRSARQTAFELKTALGSDHTRLFAIDIQQLGGTTNQQAQIAHNLGYPDFLHIELNHEFRKQLKANASVRDSFFACILRGTVK